MCRRQRAGDLGASAPPSHGIRAPCPIASPTQTLFTLSGSAVHASHGTCGQHARKRARRWPLLRLTTEQAVDADSESSNRPGSKPIAAPSRPRCALTGNQRRVRIDSKAGRHRWAAQLTVRIEARVGARVVPRVQGGWRLTQRMGKTAMVLDLPRDAQLQAMGSRCQLGAPSLTDPGLSPRPQSALGRPSGLRVRR